MKTFARDECRVEILERLRSVRVDSPKRWGTMTSHQMIDHCANACRMALGEVATRDVSTGVTRHVIKWIALYAPMRWPAGVQTVAELDRRAVVPASAFTEDVAVLARLLAQLRGRNGAAWPRHPIFGRLTERAWLRWAYLHMDHHLRQFGA